MAEPIKTGVKLLLIFMLAIVTVCATAQHAGLRINVESIRPTPTVPPVAETESFQQESLQPSGQAGFESLQPLNNPLESILYDQSHDWVRGKNQLDLYQFDLEWGAAEGLTVTRKFDEDRVDVKGRPLGMGIRGVTQEGVSFSALDGLMMGFNRERVETIDLAGISLGGSETTTMSLQQGYGSGMSTGALDYKRTVVETLTASADDPYAPLKNTQTRTTEEMGIKQGLSILGGQANLQYRRGLTSVEKPDQRPDELRTESFQLDTGLWAQTKLTAGYAQAHANQETGLHSQSRNISLTRQFNSGAAVFSVSNEAKRQNMAVTETKKQSYQVPFRFDGTVLAMKYDASTVQQNEKLLAEDRAASFTTKLGGYDVSGSWTRTMKYDKGKDNKTTNMAFSLPFRFFGTDAGVSYTSKGVQADTALVSKERIAKLNLPLSHFVKGSSFTYDIQGLQPKPGQPFKEIRTAHLLMPLTVFGTPITPDLQRITERGPDGKSMRFLASAAAPIMVIDRKVQTQYQYAALNRADGSEQNSLVTQFAIPTKPGQVTVRRQAVTEVSPSGQEKQTRVLNVTSPKVPIAQTASIQADWEAKDLPGDIEHRTTHFAVEAKPTEALQITGDYRIVDLGPLKETNERRVDMGYSLSKRLALNWRYLEKEQLDKSPLIQRTLVLQHKNEKPSDLRLRAALTSTDDHNADGDLMKVVEVGFGDRKRNVETSVRYQEYDETKLTDLGEPTIQVDMVHGDAGEVQYTMAYEDAKGRPDPRREYGVGLPLGDARLGLRLSQNVIDPTDPKKQRIRLADMYDASLESKVFSDVALGLSYRYCEYPETATVDDRVDQWLQMKLTGGKANRGGAIQFAYASGDFVELVANKPANTPTSTFSLQYEKQWDAEGNKLTLQFNKTDVTDGLPDVKDNYEGRLKFDYKF